jgi:hypothetical protein
LVTVNTAPYADPAALAAESEARAALVRDVSAAEIGDYLGPIAEEAGVVTHRFDCAKPGYVGWYWSVTVARVDEPGAPVTVDEIVLVPGGEAIVAPAWVPYRDRIEPGDMSPGDLLPVADDDPRLVPTYSFGDDPLDPEAKAQIRAVAGELGLGRVRTLSPEGIDAVAERWYDGDRGPRSPLAQAAPDHCHSCGFMIRLAGHLAPYFGVCGNGDANDDGRVVSMDHGCGAHSEVRLAKKHAPQPLPDPVFDTITLDEVDSL